MFVEGLEKGRRKKEAQVGDALLHEEEEEEKEKKKEEEEKEEKKEEEEEVEAVRTTALCKFVKCYKHLCL